MRLLRYFLRGLREIGRELASLKAVVRPRVKKIPRVGVAKDVVEHLKEKHGLVNISLFDENGVLVAGDEDLRRVLDSSTPLLDEARYIFLRNKSLWVGVFKHRGLIVVFASHHVPDVVDVFVMKRDLDRYLWGYPWEG